MPTAIRASDLHKQYRLYRKPMDRFLELFLPGPRHQKFPALAGLSFEVERGETLGLIGQNGAGKSTLLKLLSGVTTPSSGSLEVNGSIASILELGTGFHPEFSGRDNAALAAAILGLSAAEVRERLPQILEFSELEGFLDQPVKTFSSGMFMRLAFSVAVNVDPDILIIDEALAVGDGHFQKKCVDRIRQYQRDGRTILFCSHSLYFITTLCSRTMWLDHGRVRSIGDPLDVVSEYERFLLQQDRAHAGESSPLDLEPSSGTHITSLEILDPGKSPGSVLENPETLTVRVRFNAPPSIRVMRLSIIIDRAADGTQCFVFDRRVQLSGRGDGEVELQIESVSLARGDYGVVAALISASGSILDRSEERPAFSIGGKRYEIGLMRVAHSFETSGRNRR